jgi:hypothetical protein
MMDRYVALLRTCTATVGLAALVACDPLPPPKVDFAIDAPLCSMILPVSLRIDDVQVGVDTFEVFGATLVHSPQFETTSGSHVLAVHFFPSGHLIQEDSAVTLAAGDSYTFRFGFYCS